LQKTLKTVFPARHPRHQMHFGDDNLNTLLLSVFSYKTLQHRWRVLFQGCVCGLTKKICD